MSLRKTLGITQAELSGHLDVDPLMVSRWTRGLCEPAPDSQGEHTLNDWARQIQIIQEYPPEEWESFASGLLFLRKSEEESVR